MNDTAPQNYDAKNSDVEGEEDDTEIVRRAKECYRVGMHASEQWRKDALSDLEFLAGKQWDPNIESEREAQHRPALTVNRLPQFVRQVTNEQRQSKPSVTVNPVDSGSDIKTAEVLQGLIRNVEYTSNADAAYASGGQSAAITGVGYWDVCAEYESETSFEQRLSIKRIPNPMSVVIDPGAKEMAGDDARWIFKSTDMSDSEWEAMFPGKEIPKSTGWGGQGDSAANWVAEKGVRIHEYRYIKEEPDVLIELPPGMFEDKPEGGGAFISDLEDGLAATLVKMGAHTRKTARKKACWVKIVGDEIIEKGELAGQYLQLVRVVGTELEIDGKVIYEGVIRHAKDSQRMLNFFVTAEAEAIALTPKAPFIAAEGQIEDYQEDWKSANQRPLSVLTYKPTTIAGIAVPPPQRVMAEANIQAITNARMQAADDLKATTGIYDAALGARSNEQSGRAIIARTNQAQTANFHFQDNLGMAIRYTGRILIDLIPKFYSGPRIVRILGDDGKHEMVPVNGAQGDFRGEPAVGQDGQPVIDLEAGRYDVAVSMGPSYQSRRQELVAQLLELFKVNPGVSQYVMDLLVDSMDMPNAKVIAERLRKMLPPEIRPPDENKTPPVQVLMQQVQQSQQMIQQLTQAVHAAQDKLDTNAQDNEAKERIEMTKLHVEILKTMATLESKEHVASLAAEAALIGKRLGLLDFGQPIEQSEGQAEMQQQPQQQPQPPQGAMNG